MDQPGSISLVANPVFSWSSEQKKCIFPSPRSHLRIQFVWAAAYSSSATIDDNCCQLSCTVVMYCLELISKESWTRKIMYGFFSCSFSVCVFFLRNEWCEIRYIISVTFARINTFVFAGRPCLRTVS